MIEFGHPWMLLGLLGAVVPVWLHLFGRRRAPLVYFSALDFVLATNPKRARELRVREWALVAMRAGAMVLVALALARPMLPVFGSAADSVDVGSGAQAVVVLIDDSMSMSALRQGESLFEQSRRRALRLIERLPNGSRAAVVATGFPARALTRQLTADRAAVAEALRRLQPYPRRDDVNRAFALSQALLDSAADLPTRRVALFSDLQAQGWQAAVPPSSTVNGAPVVVTVDALRPDSLNNTAIERAAVNMAATDGAAATAERAAEQVRLDVSVVHHGDTAFRNYLTVRAGDRELKSLLQLQPGERAQRSFSLPAGLQWGEVLLPEDSLAADNRRLVRLDTRPSVRVALVNGAPRTVPREDEVFFAARALESVAGSGSELAVDALPADKLTPAALANYDVVVLANLADPPQPALEALIAAVKGGKGVLVSVGDNLPERPENYLEGLLPVRLVGQRGALGGHQGAQIKPVALQLSAAAATAASASVARLQRRVGGLAQDGLARVDVNNYALIQPSAQLAAAVVAPYSDGAPALTLHALGRGQVALLTTTLDRDWTDLPLQPGFPPLLYETIVALAGPQALDRREAVAVGEVSLLSRDERADQLELRPDDSQRSPVARRVLSAAMQRAGVWSLPGFEQPGRYVATELHGGVALGARPLVVTPPDSESDLTPAGLGSLAGAQPTLQRSGGLASAPGWTLLLVLLVLLLLAESAALARGARQLRWPGWLRWRWSRSG